MSTKFLVTGLTFGVLLALTPACGPAKCSPSNCAGCCDTTGKCQGGTAPEACGQPGNICQACFIGQACSAGVCSTTGLGGGTGMTGGGGGETGAGGGGATGGGGGGATGGSGGGATGGSGGGATGGSGGGATGGSGGGATGGSGGGATGGSGGGATGGDAAGPGDVTGSGSRIFLLADGGTITNLPNLSTATIGAWITEADGGLVYRAGAGQTDRTFIVRDVPPGPYLLRLNTGYYATSTRVLNLDFEVVGRPTAAAATIDPTNLSFAVNGLSSWLADDYLSLVSFNAGQAELLGFERYGTGAPTTGVTSYTGTLNYFLYSNAFGSPMIDATQGDVAYLVQRSYIFDAGVGIGSSVRSLEVSNLAMADGQASMVSGTLATPPSTTFSYDYRGSDYVAAATQLNPGTSSYFYASLYQTPHARQTTSDAFVETLTWFAYEPSTPPTTLQVALPYPASWSTVAYVGYGNSLVRSLQGAMPLTYSSRFLSMISLQTLTSTPIQPVPGPAVTPRSTAST